MTNRYEDVNYRLARRGNVRARAQREAWDAVSFLVDIVAGRVPIRDEGDEGDEGDDGHDVTEDVWSAAFDEITQTRTRTVVPDGEEVDASPRSMGMFSLLASVALVPYLRRAPRDIPRGTIDHAQACVLALIDGRTSIEQILDTSPMPVPRVLRILSHLLDTGVVGLRG